MTLFFACKYLHNFPIAKILLNPLIKGWKCQKYYTSLQETLLSTYKFWYCFLILSYFREPFKRERSVINMIYLPNKGALTWVEYSAPSQLRILMLHFNFLKSTLVRKIPTLTCVENAAPVTSSKRRSMLRSEMPDVEYIKSIIWNEDHIGHQTKIICFLNLIFFKEVKQLWRAKSFQFPNWHLHNFCFKSHNYYSWTFKIQHWINYMWPYRDKTGQ